MRSYVLVLYALQLAACGSDRDASPEPAVPVEENTQVTDPTARGQEPPPATSYSMAMKAAELPACDAAHDRQLVYLLDTKQFQTCQSGTWQVVEITTPAPVLDKTRLANSIGAIQVGQTLSEMIPEAREYLLTLATVEPAGAGKEYAIVGTDDDFACEYYYAVKLDAAGKVVNVDTGCP